MRRGASGKIEQLGSIFGGQRICSGGALGAATSKRVAFTVSSVRPSAAALALTQSHLVAASARSDRPFDQLLDGAAGVCTSTSEGFHRLQPGVVLSKHHVAGFSPGEAMLAAAVSQRPPTCRPASGTTARRHALSAGEGEHARRDTPSHPPGHLLVGRELLTSPPAVAECGRPASKIEPFSTFSIGRAATAEVRRCGPANTPSPT